MNKFLGTLQKVRGNQNLFTWLQTAERNNSQELSMEPDFLHGMKRRFPQRSQEHSQESKPPVPGTCVQPARGQGGGGLETARGTLGQPRSFIGRLGAFVMSLWQCWFIQLDLLDSKLQPFHGHYADAKQHCDHASPKIAFEFARAATWNLSRHGHGTLTKKVP